MIQIYCGDGKGKTTAAIGLAVRAAGAGIPVCFAQLMKGNQTSEIALLSDIGNITVVRPTKNFGFFKDMTNEDKAELSEIHNELLKRVFSENYKMIILDEFNSAYSYNLLDRALSRELILNSPDKEIILTGRDPDGIFLEKADYISEIKCVRHPYQKGISARKGIEF